jgi:hypothetical protein
MTNKPTDAQIEEIAKNMQRICYLPIYLMIPLAKYAIEAATEVEDDR